MLGKNKLSKISESALIQAKELGATQTEVVISNGGEELTRFAGNSIHQSVSLVDSMVHVRVIKDKKIGVARSNRIDIVGVRDTVKKAYALAKLQRADPAFESLPQSAHYQDVSATYRGRKHLGPTGRSKAISWIIDNAIKNKLDASGAFSESDGEFLIANSNGVLAYHEGKGASLSTILTGETGSGYSGQNAIGGSEIDPKKIAEIAVHKATFGEVREAPAGEYEVILEPPAVAELMDFFSWLGPNARIFHEDVSFYQGNIGKSLLHPTLNIVDDAYNPLGYPSPFDFEGHPKEKVELVTGGKLMNVVYDSYHANKYKSRNTGHALVSPNTWGPIPTNVVILPGDLDTDDMIKKIKKGLLVTRFWYTRVVQHKQLTLTGMTRDGTFLIEDGKIVGRVRNLRYTESVLEAFKDIRGIGKELSLEGSEGSPMLVPALHLGKFRFTGVSEHA